MSFIDIHTCSGPHRTTVVLAGMLLVVGCVSTPTTEMPVEEPPPAPELWLIDTGPLDLPIDCEPTRGAVYRTSFVVQPQGRVADAASESGAGCVQEALRRWVSTFEYKPLGASTSAVVDWMAVTAPRGG